MCPSIELVGRYSNLADQMRRIRQCAALASRAFSARSEPIPAPVRRVIFRLDEQLVRQLLADYEAGRTGRELAEQYGLARSTVIGLLRKHGVAGRYPRVTPSDAAEMVRLYHSGRRQVELAAQFGREPGNVWHVLKRAGAFDASC
jgi:DNA invertase Pin-like site-specific DNA recombinase